MKIVYVANARIPSLTANSIQLMKVCAALGNAGHDVTLMVPRFVQGHATNEELAQLYGVRIGFRIEWLRGYRELGRMFYEWRTALRAVRMRADVYWTINERLAARLAARGCTVVVELHETPRRSEDERAIRTLMHAHQNVTLVMVTSALRDLMKSRFPGLHGNSVIVEPNAVDADAVRDVPDAINAADARRLLGWDEDAALTVGYAGHLYAGRGIEIILGLADRFRDMQFKVMGGEGDTVTQLRHEIEHRGLANVEPLGFVANADLASKLCACDVLLMPYGRKVMVSGGAETANYASPMKMFDYMASRRAIISSRLPGIEEVLNDRNALLCVPDDLEEWEIALNRLRDPMLREALAAQARRDVERYTWGKRTERILAATAVTAT